MTREDLATVVLIAVGLGVMTACSPDGAETSEASPSSGETLAIDDSTTTVAPTTTAEVPPQSTQTSVASATTVAPKTTAEVAAQQAEASDDSTTTVVPTTSADVATTASTRAPSTPETPEASWADGCFDDPKPPPFLPSGAAPGNPVLGEAADGSVIATWGSNTPDQVTQALSTDSGQSFEIAERFDEVLKIGRFEAAVTPVGPPTGPISISVRDSDETCTRRYRTPGSIGEDGVEGSIDEAAAEEYARTWLEALDR